MAITVDDTDTLTATGGEDTLSTTTTNGTYVLVVDMSNLANGDVVVLRIKTKVLTGGSAALAYVATFAHAQEDVVKYSVPVPSPFSLTATLEQTDGSVRDFDWALLRL